MPGIGANFRASQHRWLRYSGFGSISLLAPCDTAVSPLVGSVSITSPPPDKNPVLKEFATEVTKIINEAVADMERRAGR